MKIKIIAIAAILLVFIFMLVKCNSNGKNGESAQIPGDLALSLKVEHGKFEMTIPAFGEFEAVKSTPVMVPPTIEGDQTITWLAPNNSLVKKGETVIRLDADRYKYLIEEENFNISRLNLDIRKKEKDLEKEKNDLQGQLNITSIEREMADMYGAKDETLYSKNQIIDDALDLEYLNTKTEHYKEKKNKLEKKAQAELQLLKLKRRTHQVKVDQYKAALDSMEIKAPHDGLFVYLRTRGEEPRVGLTVWRGWRIAKLPDLSNMEVKLLVLESEAGGLKENLSVSIIPDARPGITYTGTVTTVDKVAKPLSRDSLLKYFEVKVKLEKTDTSIMKPGSQVKATIFVQELDNVIAVPNQALFSDNGTTYALVKKPGQIEKREVTIGARSLTRTVVTSGLEDNEIILLNSNASNR